MEDNMQNGTRLKVIKVYVSEQIIPENGKVPHNRAGWTVAEYSKPETMENVVVVHHGLYQTKKEAKKAMKQLVLDTVE